MMNACIQTYTKKLFNPFHPDPALIVIEDIAHALAYTSRFGGHGKTFYSVAQHSLLVSALSAHDDEFYGLLHDASEAYLGDIPSPVKHTDAMAGYRRAEKRLQKKILEKFEIYTDVPESVAYADELALKIEFHSVMSPMRREFAEQMALTDEQIDDWREFLTGMSSHDAEVRFLEEFKRLQKEHLSLTTEKGG